MSAERKRAVVDCSPATGRFHFNTNPNITQEESTMAFIDEVRMLATRFRHVATLMETEKGKNDLGSEEASKYALVMPFLQKMGYSVFNPTVVIPEYPAGDGQKKVDFAIMKDGKPAIIIECKRYVGRKLTLKTERHQLRIENSYKPQLAGYFKFSEAQYAILTDGISYWFFTHRADKPNIMDQTPFFEFNFLDYTDADAEQLKRFTKSAYGDGR